jgi:hypothetical protein
MIRRQDGHPRIAFHFPGQPVANALRHRLKLRKRYAFGSVLSLDFKRDSIGELPG